MTIPENNQAQDTKSNDKELNFRAQEAKYERQLAQERTARLEAEKALAEAKRPINQDEDEAYNEPYVDDKRLDKKLKRHGQQFKEETKSEIQQAVNKAIYEERKQGWLKQNNDFYDVIQHADKLAQADPELAETILSMPEGFERQKLVYKNIKLLGMHKAAPKEPSIQEKIDANRRSPYYQPSSVGTAPYSMQGDFSQSGQKNAYDKMKELQAKLRI
jgi:hypothetical protein